MDTSLNKTEPDESGNLAVRFLVQNRIADQAPATDIGAFQLKLRLDQGKYHSVWS